MKYLICQDWTNTSNNHAGIKYLCLQLEKKYNDEYRAIVIPDYIGIQITKHGRLTRKFYIWLAKKKFNKFINKIISELDEQLIEGDKVFLLEYMEKLVPQYNLACDIKKSHPEIDLYAMVHLIPKKLDYSFTDLEFKRWIKPIDKFITLGSSLTNYLVDKGVEKEKIITSFHYVENEYYKPTFCKTLKKKVQVIAMGNQERNVNLLREVVANNPNVNFIICQGVSDLSNQFKGLNNVKLIPFVEETELRKLMDESDISLNIMNDTIGSNVIVTSMAMGLAMICSDVGSIRDYCDEDNCIFCDNNVKSFSDAVNDLVTDKIRLVRYKESSINKSKRFNISNFYLSIKSK